MSNARTLFSRAEKVCSTVGERDDERKHVTDELRANGYPMDIIEMNEQFRQRPRSTDDSREREAPKATVVLPYIRHVSECIRQFLSPLDIRTCFKPHVTLRHLYPKDPIPIDQKTGVVYQLSFEDCGDTYIGQTGRTVQHRVAEHKRSLTTADSNTSAVAEHAMERNHNIDWKGAKVIDSNGKIPPEMPFRGMAHKEEQVWHEQG